MPPLSQLLALPSEMIVCGRSYRLSPLTLTDLGAIERRIIEQCQTPAGDLVQNGIGEVAPNIADLASWIARPEGTHFTIWLSLRRRHPRVTVDEAAVLVESLASKAPPAEEHNHRDNAPDVIDLTQQANWPRLFDHFAIRFGWMPNQVGELTLAQAEHLIEASAGRPRIALLSRREVRRYFRAKVDSSQAPNATHLSSVEQFDQTDAQSSRLAWFRRNIPAIFAPLTAAALHRLAAAIERLDRPLLVRGNSTGKRRNSSVRSRVITPYNGGRLRAVTRKLDVLIESMRRSGSEGSATIPFVRAGTARFQ